MHVQRAFLQDDLQVLPGAVHVPHAGIGHGQVVAHIGHAGVLLEGALQAVDGVVQVPGVQGGLAVHGELVQLPVQLRLIVAFGDVIQRLVRLVDVFALRLHVLVGPEHGLGLVVIAHGQKIAPHGKERLGGRPALMEHELNFQVAALVQAHPGIGVGQVHPVGEISRSMAMAFRKCLSAAGKSSLSMDLMARR